MKRHNYHLVDPSPWPFLASIQALSITLGSVLYFNSFSIGYILFFIGFIQLLIISFFWWKDVIVESVYQGYHTKVVQNGLRYGVILFIVSEIMFFFSFFWAFFHSSLAPTVEIGCIWPPVGLNVFSPWEIPLLNTFVLVLSGATITWAHHSLLNGNYYQTLIGIYLTIMLAVFFTNLQLCEYIEAQFDISDGVYGSCFFMATGFHGFHVIIGTVFITVSFFRHLKFHFSRSHHLGFEAAAWYWHFVDVVWLFLFISVYWWGNMSI